MPMDFGSIGSPSDAGAASAQSSPAPFQVGDSVVGQQGAAQNKNMFTFQGPATTNMLTNDEELRGEVLWGQTKSGKTTQLVAAVDWVIRTLGKGALLVTRDGGSLGELTAYAKLGLLKVLPLARFEHPLNAMDNVTTSMWPVEHHGKWTFNSREANHKDDKDWFDRFGLQMYESGTSIGEFFQSWMAETLEVKLPQTPDRDKYYMKDGDSWRGCSAPSHVGEIHRLLFEWVHNATSQKYARNIWTFREQRAEGSKGGLIIGPDAPGNKLTKKISGWFGGSYHMVATPTGRIIQDPQVSGSASSLMPANAVQELEYRMYIRAHADVDTGIMCDAGNRLPAGCKDVTQPYLVCNVERDASGKVTRRPGITTMWDLERKYETATVASLKEDDVIIATMKKLGLMKDVTEV